MIQLKNVFFTYPKNDKAIIRNINLDIDEGEYISFHGTSGSGKSTLLSLIGLINKPSEGSILIHNKDTQKLTCDSISKIKNREIGFVFQNFNLLSRLTVYENVCLPLALNSNVHKSQYKELVTSSLEKVGMANFINSKPNQLSGGQQQRVAIARALVCDPSIILADEPTGNLDSTNSQAVYEILNELHNKGKTVCLITHDEKYANYANRRFIIEDGALNSVI